MIAQTYHSYIDQSPNKEGVDDFLSAMSFLIKSGIESLEDFNDFCDAMIDETPFPKCLTWCEIKREMNEDINQATVSQ